MPWARARMLVARLGAGVALGASLALPTAAAGAEPAGRTPLPIIERATQGERCVEAPALMRRNHMDMLKHQRDETVFGGIRGAKYSLKECIACHASAQTGSVAKSETNFCVSCHAYTAVKIDCFECHATKPAALAQRGSK
jgi:predicted CXXCH cytochrome family protein